MLKRNNSQDEDGEYEHEEAYAPFAYYKEHNSRSLLLPFGVMAFASYSYRLYFWYLT